MTDTTPLMIVTPRDLEPARNKIDDCRKNDIRPPPTTMIWDDEQDLASEEHGYPQFLRMMSEKHVRIAVRFRNLSLDQIAKVIFRYPAVDPIVVSTFRLTADKGLRIGTEWSNDIAEYDERRLHSLVLRSPSRDRQLRAGQSRGSPVYHSEHHFVEDLRDVLLAMRGEKLPPEMLWNPYTVDDEDTDMPSLSQLYDTFVPQPLSKNPTITRAIAQELLGNTNSDKMDEKIKAWNWGGRRIHLLVTGESGTGKSLVARLAHEVLYADADVQNRPFERVNCGARSESNLEFELFGATSERYTDVSTSVGTLARASYGTAFLDEFGDMPRSCQPVFLTYLDDLMIRPKGEIPPFFSFSYVVAATNRDLASLIRSTEFRNDLVQRFARQVRIPSLHERSRKEILELIDMSAQHPDENPKEAKDGRRRIEEISPDATAMLTSYEYRDGNVRELESIVHRALQSARRRNSCVIEPEDLDIPDYPSFRPDSERNVVNVMAFPAYEASVVVRDHRDLDRISERSGRPILRDGDAYGVILDNVLYECKSS